MRRRIPPDDKTAITPQTQDSTRDQRRAQALRANLKRRKAQSRGRAAAGDTEADHTETAENPIKSP